MRAKSFLVHKLLLIFGKVNEKVHNEMCRLSEIRAVFGAFFVGFGFVFEMREQPGT